MLNRFVIADPNKCIGCYTCMAGCVVKHEQAGLQAYPRLQVTHTRAGTMPIQCHHCDDPACAAVCPVKAISVQNQSVQINETLCIGCKMCSLACPFGAITPHGTLPPSLQETGTFEQHRFNAEPRWPVPLYGQSGQMTELHPILAWSIGQKAVAVKCDLCQSSADGPECVRLCPTNALRLVESEDIERLSKNKRSSAVAEAAALAKNPAPGRG